MESAPFCSHQKIGSNFDGILHIGALFAGGKEGAKLVSVGLGQAIGGAEGVQHPGGIVIPGIGLIGLIVIEVRRKALQLSGFARNGFRRNCACADRYS